MYFDDFTEGRVFETDALTLTEAGVVDFGLTWDPQPFHIDSEAAKGSIYGGLIASGFHTLVLCWRMFVQLGHLRDCSIGGSGMDELRWLKPVFAGDTIRARITVRDPRPSRSKPDRGSLVWNIEALNQAGDVVLTARITSILRRRPTA